MPHGRTADNEISTTIVRNLSVLGSDSPPSDRHGASPSITTTPHSSSPSLRSDAKIQPSSHSLVQQSESSASYAPSTSPTTKPTGAQPSTSSPSKARPRAPPIFHFLAGLATGSISAVLLQPADLLKTRVQQARGHSVGAALREILSQPGAISQLWRGTLPSVIRTGLGSALYFASLNALRANWPNSAGGKNAGDEETIHEKVDRPAGDMRQELRRVASTNPWQSTAAVPAGPDDNVSVPGPALDTTISVHAASPMSTAFSSNAKATPADSSIPPQLSATANLLAGALARGGAGFIMMPITVLKVRYESSLYNSYGSSVGLVGATRAIVAREGIRGLYAGYGATLVRDAPHAGLYILFYERAKGVMGRWWPATPPSSSVTGSGGSATRANTVNFFSGVLAAGAATAATNPFDAIKTRIQLLPEQYRNMPQAAAAMLRDEGPRALFDGLSLRMARKALSSALAWTIYEDLIRRAEDRYRRLAEMEEEEKQRRTVSVSASQ